VPEQVNVPAVGRVDRKWVIAGLGVSAGIVAYAWWRRSSVAEAPVPGEGDLAAEDLYGTAGTGGQGIDAYQGAAVGGASYSGQPAGEGPPLTNAEWAQRVVDLLEGVGFERNFAATTIGKYLSGNALTTAEKLLVQAAVGLLGYPPAGALPIISAPATPTPTPTPTPTAPTTVSPPATVSARAASGGRWVITWSGVSGATGYQLRSVTGHTGDPIRSVSASTRSYTTTALPRTGHLAFEVRTRKGSAVSAWKRTTVRAG
jgi:hypothetical protein